VATLAAQFASGFPEKALTPAEVQGFLLDHRADPVKAVEEVGAYATNILDLRARGANVASSSSTVIAEDSKVNALVSVVVQQGWISWNRKAITLKK